MKSLWEEGASFESFAPLKGDISTDVLIIGGGMCGLLCAYMLHRSGVDYVLAEAETVCGGVTKNTTAKITAQHGMIYGKLIGRLGKGVAELYLRANQDAVRQYAELCKNIDCGFEYKNSYVYSLTDRRKAEAEAVALKNLGVGGAFCDSLPLPFPVAGAVKLEGQAQFDPLKFASELSKGLNIYEHTKVCELADKGKTAVTEGGRIRAKRIIVATHFPFLNKHGSYYLKLYQHRSYVIALKDGEQLDGMYVDEDEKGMSFRNYGDMLLVGGGSHRTGKKGGGWQELRDIAKHYYPGASECAAWATQDCMSLDGVPYIGQYSAGTEGLYVATGFNKWGMTSSMVAATLLTDLIKGKENPCRSVFSPSRSIFQPQLALNACEAVASWLTPTRRRCPHLGCALKWNELEHTWDCPCHGSRFTNDGKLIDNPSTDDLKR